MFGEAEKTLIASSGPDFRGLAEIETRAVASVAMSVVKYLGKAPGIRENSHITNAP